MALSSLRRYVIPTVTVLGGGIAGLAAAAALSAEGFQVTVLEKRSVAGGRASSYEDRGDWIDNCQHVLMGCCTNLLRFYRMLGVREKIRFYDSLNFLLPGRGIRTLRAGRLPAPLHLAPSFLRLPAVRFRCRLRIVRALGRLLREAPQDETPFSTWLSGHGQGSEARAAFWDPIVISALNARPEDASCRYAFKLFREAFLGSPDGYLLGIPTVPLAELYTGHAASLLRRQGSELRLGETVREIRGDPEGNVAGVVSSGGGFEADYVVSALPPRALRRLVPPTWKEAAWCRALGRLRFSPIVSAHFWFNREVLPVPFLTVPGRTIQWIFNRSRLLERFDGPEHLEVVVSAADGLSDLPSEEVEGLFWEEMTSLLPGLSRKDLLRTRVLREREATFLPDPESVGVRPRCDDPGNNLFLAGDWVQTGWPATMEGSAISGFRAAEAVLRREGREERFEVPGLRPSALVRWVGGG